MTLFDRYVVVDWSASSKPTTGPDSIWIASIQAAGDLLLVNPPTRIQAFEWLLSHLSGAPNERVLVGLDAAFGYPAGFGAKLGLGASRQWRLIWQELAALVVDDARNRNNRFDVAGALNERLGDEPGPFWGNGLGRDVAALPRKKVRYPWQDLPEFRATEVYGSSGARKPKSVWQLSGAGTVGGQTMTLLPYLEAIREHGDLSARVRVWPFETGFTRKPSASDSIVVAEVWPSAMPDALVQAAGHLIKDANQVDALARHFAVMDDAGTLANWFAMAELDEETKRIAIEEEGWILWSD